MSRSLTFVLVLVVGCSANLPDGRFRCNDDTACPSPLRCRTSEHLCYRDVTPGTDTGIPGDDGGVPDAGRDVGACSDCVDVTFTNVRPDLLGAVTGMEITIEGTSYPLPDYGETAGPYPAHLGDGMLDITVNGIESHDPAAAGITYVAALTPNGAGLLVLQAPLATPATGHTIVRPIDVISSDGGATHLLTDPDGMPQILSTTSSTHDFDLDDTMRYSLMLHRFNAGATPATPLAAIDTSKLPHGGAYYLFVAGDPARHLTSPDALRFIPASPGQGAIASLPIAWTMNATTSTIEICDASRLLVTVPPMTLVGAFPNSVASRNLQARDTIAGTDCSSTTFRNFTLPDLPATLSSARMVVGVIGVPGPAATDPWGAGGGHEGPPSTSFAAQVVTYANGVPVMDLGFGSTDLGDVVTVPMFHADSYEWPGPPGNLVITYGPTTRHFSWSLTTHTAAVLALTDGTNYVAVEIATPYGQDWTANAINGVP